MFSKVAGRRFTFVLQLVMIQGTSDISTFSGTFRQKYLQLLAVTVTDA